MRKQDIIIGEEYAVAPHDYTYYSGAAQRARVVSEAETPAGLSFQRKRAPGHMIQYLMPDGTDWMLGNKRPYRRVVPNREIRESWATYAARQGREAEERRRAATRANRAREERAVQVGEFLIPALRHAGLADTLGQVYSPDVEAALRRHTTDFDAEGRFNAPLARQLIDYVRDGGRIEVSVADLTQILTTGIRDHISDAMRRHLAAHIDSVTRPEEG